MTNVKVMLSITNLTGGGAERVVSVWANELTRYGCEVYLLLAGREQQEYPLDEKVNIISVSPTYDEYKTLSILKKYVYRRRLIKQVQPDYIISFLSQNRIWTYLCSWGIKAKRIETMRISPWNASGMSGLKGQLNKRCFAKAYKMILQSADQAPYFSDKIQRKSVVIPNPISETYKTYYKTQFPSETKAFIAAGRLSEQKNYMMMIDAFSQIVRENKGRDLCLKIFGESDPPRYIEKLKKYIEDKGMEKHILLMGRSSCIEKEYVKSDVFLMSSNFEGMPNALAEAMACKLVCISTDCKTGPRDLIDNGENGYLVPVGDSVALANEIRKVMDMSAEEREKIGQMARDKIMSYCSKENSVIKLISILKAG